MIEIPTLNDMVLVSLMFCVNTSGITKATITAKINNPALCLASKTLNFCRLYLVPPIKKDNPATNNRFPKTEPVKEASTTPTSPAFKEKMEMINSTALPKVAFKSPPILGPMTIAKLSVALPMNPASAMIVKQYTMNMITLGQCSKEPMTDKGTPSTTSPKNILFTILLLTILYVLFI